MYFVLSLEGVKIFHSLAGVVAHWKGLGQRECHPSPLGLLAGDLDRLGVDPLGIVLILVVFQENPSCQEDTQVQLTQINY